jgi:hypothetical protein
MIRVDRRTVSRPEQEKPKDHSLEEVIAKLDGLNMKPRKVLNIPEGKNLDSYTEKCIVKDFRISRPYSHDGETRVRVMGKFFEDYEASSPIHIDYVHTFN